MLDETDLRFQAYFLRDRHDVTAHWLSHGGLHFGGYPFLSVLWHRHGSPALMRN